MNERKERQRKREYYKKGLRERKIQKKLIRNIDKDRNSEEKTEKDC